MYLKDFLLLAWVAFGMLGCQETIYTKQQSAFIVLKTPTFRYADMGFISEGKNGIKVEIYQSGSVVMRMKLSPNTVCFSTLECLSRASFNERVLSALYPESLLEDIFRQKAIFNGQNRQKIRNGFTQQLVKKGLYHIEYRVFNHEASFRDTINHIVIKVKRMTS